MDAVIKVGGSLAEKPENLRKLCETISNLGGRYQILVVPGGGKFADLVREVDRQYSLTPVAGHKMAILGMDQYGLLLSALIRNSQATTTLAEAEEVVKSNKTAVLLPSHVMLEDQSLEVSWDVTSDSIAAYIANQIHAAKLILITNVDGLFTSDPTKNPNAELISKTTVPELLKSDKRTCVDRFLPRVLRNVNFSCYVVNGSRPERVEKILTEKRAVSTIILSG